MGQAPLLTVPLLEELKARWRAAGAAVVGGLRPGLSDPEMDELTARLGLRVPSEARVWWGWHDGVPANAVNVGSTREITGTGWQFLPLAEAVTQCINERKLAAEATGGEGVARRWSPSWLPVSVDIGGGVFVVNCANREERATPIYYIEREAPDPAPSTPSARTFGEMVRWWIEAFDDGAYYYDSVQRRLLFHYERLDPVRELTRLV